jgi:hypothetical protein
VSKGKAEDDEVDIQRGLAFGIAAGGLAGNVWFLKSAVGLLGLGLKGDWSPWLTWLPWALLAGAICCALGNVPLMVKGLQEYEAVFMVTLFGGTNIAVGCISGAVVMCEMDNESVYKKVCYWLSILAILSGLFVINMAKVNAVGDAMDMDLQPSLSPRERTRAGSIMRERGQTMFTITDIVGSGENVPVLWANPFAGQGATLGENESRKRANTSFPVQSCGLLDDSELALTKPRRTTDFP